MSDVCSIVAFGLFVMPWIVLLAVVAAEAAKEDR